MWLWERGHVREHHYVHIGPQENVLCCSDYWCKRHGRTCDYATCAWASRAQVTALAYSSRSVSLTFQQWRFWHALGSMTRQLHISLSALSTHRHLSGEAQTPPRRWKTTSKHFWRIIYLLLGLPLSLTHCNIYLFYFFFDMFCCCWLIHSAPVIPPYTDMLFAPRGNISHFAPWQILIDTFRAIIWVLFYRDTRFVLMESGRNITRTLAVGGCWHRQTFSRASLVLLHKSVDALLPLWQLETYLEKQKHWEAVGQTAVL